MENFMVRHGDLLLTKIDSLPKEAVKRKTNIILEGEATGHAHRITGGTVLEAGEEVYVKIPESGAIIHEEHNRIELPAGNYVVTRQREYNPYAKAVRNVVD